MGGLPYVSYEPVQDFFHQLYVHELRHLKEVFFFHEIPVSAPDERTAGCSGANAPDFFGRRRCE